MDFSIPPELDDLATRVRRFVDDEVIPLESEIDVEAGDIAAIADLRAKAKAEGLWAPHLPQEYGGQDTGLMGMCLVFEQAGRSLLGPLALNCAAPDEGTMHLLLMAARPPQLEQYLTPLANGDIRSCFAMTEPAPGGGSDPTMLRTRAERKGDGWIINGDKWFITGADGAAFSVVCAVTDPDAPAHSKASLFIVDTDNPGFKVVKRTPIMGSGGAGGHCEVALEDCEVADDAMLGGEGEGFKLMQVRLGPARLTHCMRWIGVAQRALDIAANRAIEREAFGSALAGHQSIQWMLADSEMDLYASRMMTLHAAWRISEGDQARQETSACKVFVAEAINRVIDRSVQILGALGVTQYTPVELFFRDARAFRIYDGPSEVHRMVVARRILRRAADGRQATGLTGVAGGLVGE